MSAPFLKVFGAALLGLLCWNSVPAALAESGFSLAPYSASATQTASSITMPPQVSLAVQQAQQLWEHYQAYEASYDPELAQLYAASATVQIQHQRPEGQSPFTEIIPTGQYQQSLRQLMPVAKAAGDCSLYENVRFIEKGAWVIVQATRVDGRGGYRVPHWMTIVPDATNPLGGTVIAEVAVIQEAQ